MDISDRLLVVSGEDGATQIIMPVQAADGILPRNPHDDLISGVSDQNDCFVAFRDRRARALSSGGEAAGAADQGLDGRENTINSSHSTVEESSFSIEEALKTLHLLLKNHHLYMNREHKPDFPGDDLIKIACVFHHNVIACVFRGT